MAKIYKKLTLAELQALPAGEHIIITKNGFIHGCSALIRKCVKDTLIPIVCTEGAEIRTLSFPVATYSSDWYAERISTVELDVPGLRIAHIGANDEELNINLDIDASDETEAKKIAAVASDALNHILAASVEPDFLVSAIGAMIENGSITFFTTGGWDGEKDVFMNSTVFVDSEISIGISEDDWDAGPSEAVAKFLADQVRKGKLHFKPIVEK